jgi:hypothetical protein
MALFDDLQTVVTGILATQAPDTCNILAETSVSDGGGGQRKTWTPINGSPLPCICQPKTGHKQVAAEKWEVVTDHVLFIKADAVVTSKHRIQVLSRGPLAARTFRIETILEQMGVVKEISMKLVE